MLVETKERLKKRGYGDIGEFENKPLWGISGHDQFILKCLCSELVGQQFVSIPENPTTARRLDEPNYIVDQFEKGGFEVVKPISVLNTGGTTLFTSAGVQILEPVFHKGSKLSEKSQFVAQPVFRTQYLGLAAEGFCSSFVNLTTVSTGLSPERHVANLDFWLDFLLNLGMKDQSFSFLIEQRDEKWGDKKFTIDILRINYQGLPIGDSCFIENFPQNDRPNYSVSDIGFGLERVRWVLAGGLFWNNVYVNGVTGDQNASILDCCNTLALLAGSGVNPSNKEAGYRFRKLSKGLISAGGVNESEINHLLSSQWSRWTNWTDLPVSRDTTADLINKENARNLNAEILQRLRDLGHDDVGIDINLPTRVVLKLLKGTSVKLDELNGVLIGLKLDSYEA